MTKDRYPEKERNRCVSAIEASMLCLKDYRRDHAGHAMCEALFRDALHQINAVAANLKKLAKARLIQARTGKKNGHLHIEYRAIEETP